MSDFSAPYSTKTAQINAITRAFVSQEPCKFEVNATCGQLVDLAFFLRLAIEKGICDDKQTVENVATLADTIATLITQDYPSFSDFDWDNPVRYFEALRESSKEPDPQLVAIFDSLFQKLQQAVDAIDSSDAADE
jgi:hypothetical protein